MASFYENGKYIKTNWKAGDKITATKLNKIEESIEAVNDNDISRHVEADARLDALEAKDATHDKELTNVKNLIEDAKDAAELGDYEINSRMQFLEDELEEAVAEVNNVASTVDGKITKAEADMDAAVAEVYDVAETVDGKIAEAVAEVKNLHYYSVVSLKSQEEIQAVLDISGNIKFIGDMSINLTKPLYIKSNTRVDFNNVVLTASDEFDGVACLVSENTSNILIENLNVNSNSKNVSQMSFTNIVNLEIKNGDFYNAGTTGVILENVSNVKIFNNAFHDNLKWNLYISKCNDVKVENNKSFNSERYDGFKFAGNNIDEDVVECSNIVFTSNIGYGNAKDGFDYASNNGENIIITDNIFYDNGMYGINVKTVYQGEGIKNINISNNILKNNILGGVEIVDQHDDESKKINQINIQNNTISSIKNGKDLSEKGGIRIIKVITGTISGNTIQNYDVGVVTCGIENIVLSNNNLIDCFRSMFIKGKITMDWHDNICEKTLSSNNNNILYNSIKADGQSGGYCIRIGDSATDDINDTLVSNNKLYNDANREQIVKVIDKNIISVNNVIGSGDTPPQFGSYTTVFYNTDLTTDTLYWVQTSKTSSAPVWKPINF